MYTLRTTERVLDDLTGTVLNDQVHWSKRAILKASLKADSSLLFDIVEAIASQQSMEHNGISRVREDGIIGRSSRFQRRFVLENFDEELLHTTPIVICKLIKIFQTELRPSFITVSPAGVEQSIMYGGSDEPARLSLWVHLPKRGDVVFAETRTRNKHGIDEIIAATHATHRVEFKVGHGLADQYEIIPSTFREQVRPWSS